MRIASPDRCRIRQPNQTKKCLGAFGLPTLEHVMELQDFHELSPHPHARAQSRRGILRHERYSVAAQSIECPAIEIVEIYPLEEDVPALDSAVLPSIGQQLISDC